MDSSKRRLGRVAMLSLVPALLLGLFAPAALAKASVERVEDVTTVVPTAFVDDNPAGVELMFAECDYVQRVEKPDGSAIETQQCHLTEPFIVFPGEPPTSALANTDGECIWYSDYFSATDPGGERVWAEKVRLTVTPSGNVSVTSWYPAEPLDCDE